MNRRDILFLAAAAPAIAAGGRAASAAAGPASPTAAADPLADAAREAYVYFLPLVKVAALRARGAGRVVNTFQHKRALTSPQTQTVTAPNNDTLSSSAFVDLTAGPVEIVLPPTGARYFSVQLMDAWTNTFAVLGTRTTGPAGGAFTLVGPTDPAPPRALRSPTAQVWALARLLPDGPADLSAANALQDGLIIKARAAPPAPRVASPAAAVAAAGWQGFFAAAQRQLDLTPPPPTDEAVLRRIAPLGISLGGSFDAGRFTPSEMQRIAAGVARAQAEVRDLKAIFRTVDGWAYQSAQIGAYGQDYQLRAATCQWGIGALVPQEAMYARAAGEDGDYTYPGGGSYRLHFPRGDRPPVNAFWSLTLYEAHDDGQVFFFDNPQRRYSLGDRSGLADNPDGSLDLWISPNDPGGARTSNWLPAPARGRFALVLRAYLPSRAMVDGDYRLPPVRRA